jgi:hypothetical protein
MEELKSINGNWMQTIAHLLNKMVTNTENCTGNTEVSIIESVCLPPNQHIEVYNPHSVKPPKITIEKRTCPSPPKVSKIKKSDLYERNCGSWNPTNSNYKRCMNCVDTHYTEVENTKGYVSITDMNVQKKCYCKKK